MKKKLISILALMASISLVACSTAESAGKKAKKKVKEDIDKLESTIKDYIDDETDLDNIDGTKKDTKDTSGETTADPSETPADAETIPTDTKGDFDPDVKFTIYDMDNNAVTEEIFSKNKVTMINFWEPWCGPCVAEMPELEKLYEDYKDKGLQIIGVFSATDQMDDVKSVLADAKTTYPICAYDEVFDIYQTGYVPTTIFVDQNGHILPASNGYSDNAIVGGNSYEDWAKIIDGFLN